MLNPDILSIIEEFGDIYVEVITNGDSLDEEKITNLFESGLNTIVVSLYDGEFQIETKEGEGTNIHIHVPFINNIN